MLLDLVKNIGGIITSPGKTLGNLMQAKNWLPIFILILLAVCVHSNIVLPAKMAETAENSWIPDYFPGEQLPDFQAGITLTKRILVTAAALLEVSLALIIGAFLVYLFFGIGGAEGYYIHFFSLVVGASIIDTLLPIVRDALSLVLNSNLAAFTNLSGLFPAVNPQSLGFWFFSQVDLFVIWYLAALAAGVAVFAKMRFSRCLFISFLYFVCRSLAAAFFSYLGVKIISALLPHV
ncbi:MAG: hypothetical protein L0Y73_05675 [Candidatus Aminicenantes bacterium]|nr:hypothetical protein [Candidatus Aminicenantes bacterium]